MTRALAATLHGDVLLPFERAVDKVFGMIIDLGEEASRRLAELFFEQGEAVQDVADAVTDQS